MNKISLILVDYKTPVKTLKYIRRFTNAVDCIESIHILVIDNSMEQVWKKYCLSNGISIKQLKEQVVKECNNMWEITLDNIQIYCVEACDNLGYGKGNNLGAVISYKLWGDTRLLISNNDLEFPSKLSLEAFEHILNQYDDVAIVGPMVKSTKNEQQSPHKKLDILHALIFKYFYLLLNPSALKKISDVEVTSQNGYTYWVTGCFLYVDSKAFFKCGMFDSKTFLYCEEKIIAERLLKYNKRMYFLADEVIIHNHGQSIKNALSVLKAAQYGFESQIYYFKNYLKVSDFKLNLAKISFGLYKILYPIKCQLKKLRCN